MAKAKKTTKQKSQEADTLAVADSKENAVKKVLSVSVSVDSPEQQIETKSIEAPATIKLRPGQVLYVRITETGEEVEPQVVSRSTWDKYLSKNPNFKLKKNTV